MTTALLASVPLDDDRDPVDPDQIQGILTVGEVVELCYYCVCGDCV